MFTQASMLKQMFEHALHHSHPGQVYTLEMIHGGHVFNICLSTEALGPSKHPVVCYLDV